MTKRTTVQRGYGAEHQRTRDRLRPTVEAGRARCTELVCLMPTRHIQPGTPWDLAHDIPGQTYRGPAHARCNRAEGARRGNSRRSHPRPASQPTNHPEPAGSYPIAHEP